MKQNHRMQESWNSAVIISDQYTLYTLLTVVESSLGSSLRSAARLERCTRHPSPLQPWTFSWLLHITAPCLGMCGPSSPRLWHSRVPVTLCWRSRSVSTLLHPSFQTMCTLLQAPISTLSLDPT